MKRGTNIIKLNEHRNITFIDFIMEKDHANTIVSLILDRHGVKILNNELINGSYRFNCKYRKSTFQVRIHFDNIRYSSAISFDKNKIPLKLSNILKNELEHFLFISEEIARRQAA